MNFPGSIYQKRGRYYWQVRLPGEDKSRAIALKPKGSRLATTNKGVALEVAKQLYQKVLQTEQGYKCFDQRIITLIAVYQRHADRYYNKKAATWIKWGLGYLGKYFGTEIIGDFGPLKLKQLQQRLIKKNISRGVINSITALTKRIFKWAVSEQMVPVEIYQALLTVPGLKWGRSGAKETEKVKPIEEKYVRVIARHTTPVIAAMLKLQLLTGMRPGEVVIMRPCDIEKKNGAWLYQPHYHKTKYRGHHRVVAIGPKGQKVLAPFLDRDIEQYCFTPAESNLSRGKKSPAQITERYKTDSYRQAVFYAIDAANKALRDRGGMKAKKVPHFSPHQIRHTHATAVRSKYGLDAAKAVLGHKTTEMTEIYAELDMGKAIKVAIEQG